MNLSSPDFKNQEKIPLKFTGDGEDINPNLELSEIPENAKSFVLIMDDPDAPVGIWVHWLVWNINPNIKKILENSLPENAVQGENSWGRNDYGGPMPPSGTHRYFFKLYALDIELDLQEGSNKQELEDIMQAHVIEKAELVGLYR